MTANLALTTRRAFLAGGAVLSFRPMAWAEIARSKLRSTAGRRYPLGARLPLGFKDLIRKQNAKARAVNEVLATIPGYTNAIEKAHPFFVAPPPSPPSKFDLRDEGKVSPVKDQQPCGSCWAFAAIAAYESSHAIVNGLSYNEPTGSKTKDETDISEQELVDCTFADADCVLGGWHEMAFLYLELTGLVGTNPYYYRGSKGSCTTNIQRSYFVSNWAYVSDALNPSNAELKSAIQSHGALATGVYADDHWFNYGQDLGDGTPWGSDPNHVFTGTPATTLQPGDTNHEVALVGWDDNLGGGVWLVKNSWGADWGENGFMKLPYGKYNIGTGASWVIAKPDSVPNPTSLAVSTMP